MAPVQQPSSMDLIRTTLTDKFDIEPDSAEPGALLAEVGMDSIMIVELGVIIKTETGAEFTDDEAASLTLAGLAALVDERRRPA
ncbi:acyl carrier protein [Streptomyces sp. NBC_00690]|uniref:acyl carrier protein n=1 Tax=Streptomyces sp. NBC_00690 TaxID=2975808 RepID=UPI002E2C877C|nr:acyl carrier protein [Streptomyces sp. NBC_00690]